MALKGDVGHLTETALQEMIEQTEARIAAITPDIPLRRYSIEACRIFQDCCRRMIEGADTVEALSDEMLVRQHQAALRHGVAGQL